MLKSTAFVTLGLAVSAVFAVPHIQVKRADVSRSEWKTHDLEGYFKFRQRFRALDCASQRDTPFYTECCYPLGSDESLSSRPAHCTPSAASCTAPGSTPPPVPEVPAPAPAPAPVEDDDDEYEWVCEEEDVAPEEDYDADLPYCDELEDGEDYEVVNPPPTTTTTIVDVLPSQPPSQPEPQPQPQPEPQPQPQPEPQPQPQPEPQPQPQPPASNVNSGGFATWYRQNGNAGACGEFKSDNDLIGAIDHERYGNNFGVKSGECGKRVRITNTRNGQSVEITIMDVCPSCENGNSIDLSVGAFQRIASLDDGMVPITWVYL